MLSSVDTQEIRVPFRNNATQRLLAILTRRVWLPKFIYVCIPWFYLFAGLSALLASLYISNWYWILPHYLIFSIACLHLGAIVIRWRKAPLDSGAQQTDSRTANSSP
jgi:hypothetical protein